MKFNVEEMNSVADALNNIFGPLKAIFDSAKNMVTAAGENQFAETLHAHFNKIENSFNNSVRPAFTNVKADLSQSAENMEAFNKAMAGVADPNTSAADGVEQKRHTGDFSAV